MKKLILLFTIFFGVLVIISCSKEEELTDTELLVQNSPWTFYDYWLLEIIGSYESNLTEQDIENRVIQNSAGFQIAYYSDGSAESISNNGNVIMEWKWELLLDNKIKITNNNFYDSIRILSISVSSKQFIVGQKGSTYDEVTKESIEHYGALFYR